MEQWKPVMNYPNYEISSLGNVRKLLKKKTYIPIAVSPGPKYLMFCVNEKGKIKKLYVHREIMHVFNPNSDPMLNQVCFKDGNIYNVNLENLYWSSQTRRMRRRFEEGKYLKGQDHFAAKLTDQDVLEIRALWKSERYSQRQIAERFGIHPSTCSNILRGRFWTHLK